MQKIHFSPKRLRQRKEATNKKRMPIARCSCGFEILVVPDLKAMNRAINNHLVAMHKKTYYSSEESLAKQVLLVANKMSLINDR